LARIAELGLTQCLHLLDYVPDEDLPALYAGAAVVVLPSHYEGFGLPVLEGMACGTPVVCSDAASLPEVAGEAALLVPPGQPEALVTALRRVLDNPEQAAAMRAAGLTQARRFTWDNTAQAVLTAYARVIKL
jgi:glycosyltransferase involved in cell wall biosynthesis